jgi:hypothetical protein|tara:strand:+ start:565 stop:807 length:243 start_codon:yes stop_codon:yes gene_type:complete
VPTVEPLNTIPLQQFLQAVKAAEAARVANVTLDMNTAKNLAFTLGIVMSRLHGDLELLVAQSKDSSDEVINITMDGGSKF